MTFTPVRVRESFSPFSPLATLLYPPRPTWNPGPIRGYYLDGRPIRAQRATLTMTWNYTPALLMNQIMLLPVARPIQITLPSPFNQIEDAVSWHWWQGYLQWPVADTATRQVNEWGSFTLTLVGALDLGEVP